MKDLQYVGPASTKWTFNGVALKEETEDYYMGHILTVIMVVIMAIIGGGSTIFLVISLPAVIIWKIYRKIKYGYKLTD